jgi:hypothetical protein
MTTACRDGRSRQWIEARNLILAGVALLNLTGICLLMTAVSEQVRSIWPSVAVCAVILGAVGATGLALLIRGLLSCRSARRIA